MPGHRALLWFGFPESVQHLLWQRARTAQLPSRAHPPSGSCVFPP